VVAAIENPNMHISMSNPTLSFSFCILLSLIAHPLTKMNGTVNAAKSKQKTKSRCIFFNMIS